VADYMRNEARFRVVERTDPERFKEFLRQSQKSATERYSLYEQLAGVKVPPGDASADAAPAASDRTEE
jgi:hypothetical protein